MPGENRVMVDLPLRLQKAKAAAFALEQERNELQEKLKKKEAEAKHYREALQTIRHTGRGRHIKIASKALDESHE